MPTLVPIYVKFITRETVLVSPSVADKYQKKLFRVGDKIRYRRIGNSNIYKSEIVHIVDKLLFLQA